MPNSNHLSRLIHFYHTHHRLPSYRELLRETGLRSTNAIHKLVAKWMELNFLTKDRSGKLVPGSRLNGLPFLGIIAAGWPSPAEEELANTMTLDEFLIGNREATYMLTVSGDSMIDAGIHPQDIVLVERGRDPRDGDIVVAEVDNGWTLKYFRKKNSKVYLEAANKKYPPIYPHEELKIAAVVTAVVRKYKRI